MLDPIPGLYWLPEDAQMYSNKIDGVNPRRSICDQAAHREVSKKNVLTSCRQAGHPAPTTVLAWLHGIKWWGIGLGFGHLHNS